MCVGGGRLEPDDDIQFFPFRVTNNFSSQSSAHAAEYRTSELRRGSYGWRPRLTVMINRKDYYGRNCNPHFWFRRGYLWKCEHVRMDFCRCFPTGRTTSAEGGVVFPHLARYQGRRGSGRTPRRRQVELPLLARPKCVSTRAPNGASRAVAPTTAYAIGGTATLAL